MREGLFLECSEKSCRFRYPAFPVINESESCPRCGGEAVVVGHVLLSVEDKICINRHQNQWDIIPVLDNLRSAYNVGSIFRTANGFGISKIVLGGISPTTNHPGFLKTSLGAEKSIAAEQTLNTFDYINKQKAKGFQVISLENTPHSCPLIHLSCSQLSKKILLVLGNEKLGIDPGILSISDFVLSIPMLGTKQSHNVCVAFGIAIFQLTNISFNADMI